MSICIVMQSLCLEAFIRLGEGVLGEFLGWTWITTQGEPFNIKALVVSFPLFSNNKQLLVHLPKMYMFMYHLA